MAYVREEVGDLHEWVDDFERDVRGGLISGCPGEPDIRPASITLTVQ